MQRRQWIQFLTASSAASLSPMAFGIPSPEQWDQQCDVIVIGAGAAGLSAALSAAQSGARVILFEKMEFIGGDTLTCGGYFSVPDSDIQRQIGIKDSASVFYQQTLLSGQGRNDPALARILAQQAKPTMNWLMVQGVHFEQQVYQIYGSEFRRCVHPIQPRGFAYIQALSESCLDHHVHIQTQSSLQQLCINSSGRVTGAMIVTHSSQLAVQARLGVVLAAGGFGANKDMVATYAPHLAQFPCDCGPGSTGEVMQTAMGIGAQTVNLDVIECIPEGSSTPSHSVRIYVVLEGLMFINQQGKRFIDETKGRHDLAKAILEQGLNHCFTIVDSANVAHLDKSQQKNIYRALYAGQAYREDSLQALASTLGVPWNNLQHSLKQLSLSQRPKVAPFWAVRMYPWIHYTLGGLAINAQGQCLDQNGQTISGLFAAGQITGNIHGANRLGGSGLTDAFVFGRICGRNVAANTN